MKKTITIFLALAFLTHCAPVDQEGGPASSHASYWEVPAYKILPIYGPSDAKGIIFWSHGVSGKSVQWKSPPARFIRDFSSAKWDVFKVNRNNLEENGWSASGGRHIAHVIKLAKKAKRDGYRYIIAGGQSYGGAISLEAGAEKDLFYGIIATAPGHGSDACGSGTNTFRISDNLTTQLVRAIERVKTPRVLLTMAKGDECMGFNEPTGQLRKALLRSKASFVFMDDKMPIHGHFAGNRHQFRIWYGKCLSHFFDPENSPQPNENICPPPNPVPRYLLSKDYRVPTKSGDEKNLIGAWSGTYDLVRRGRQDARNICLIVENDLGDTLVTKMAYGAGRRQRLNMSTHNRPFFKIGTDYIYTGSKNFRIKLTPNSQYSEMAMHIISSKGTTEWTATMKRGCLFHQ